MAAIDNRFKDWGLFKYWFRGVEKFAPWVNKIYFITWGHVPTWLD
ncbi:MAG: capsule biosynthesis protein CapK, partial [Solobacterium sp.]|nr:capsule biosynthesis protein CapK [Solobacterium sp.]